MLVIAHNAPKPIEASIFPCGVCNKGVGTNSIKYLVSGFWVHKRCSKVKGCLKPNPDFKCRKCRGEVSNTTIPDIKPVDINSEEIEKLQHRKMGLVSI